MTHTQSQEAVNQHYGNNTNVHIEQAILQGLQAVGKNINTLTTTDLAPADQFHTGGLSATLELARRIGMTESMRLLDVGGGIGGTCPHPCDNVWVQR